MTKVYSDLHERFRRLEQKTKREPYSPAVEVDGKEIHSFGNDPGWQGASLFFGFEGYEPDETDVGRVNIATFTRDKGVLVDLSGFEQVVPYNGKLYGINFYSYPGKIIRFTYDLVEETRLTLTVNAYIDTAHRVNNKLYLGHHGCPASITKVDLDTFTEDGFITLLASDGNNISVLHSPDGEYMYVGFLYAATAPYPPDWTSKIVKIRLSDFTRFDVLALPPAEKDTFHHMSGMHSDDTYLYTCNEPLYGGRIARVLLSNFTFVDKMVLSGDEAYCRDIIHYLGNLYVATDPGLVKITASTMTRVGRVDAVYGWYCWNVTLSGSYLYFIDYGDPYWEEEPDRVIKVTLSTFTLHSVLEFSLADPYDWYVRWVAAG